MKRSKSRRTATSFDRCRSDLLKRCERSLLGLRRHYERASTKAQRTLAREMGKPMRREVLRKITVFIDRKDYVSVLNENHDMDDGRASAHRPRRHSAPAPQVRRGCPWGKTPLQRRTLEIREVNIG
jgi:hypothetical protein